MSIRDTKPFLDEHAQLRDHVEHLAIVARELPGLSIDDRADVVERVAVFLVEILLPHAAVEERLLYPQAARVLGEDDASDAVARDRAEVRDLLHRLASADIGDSGRIQECLFALHALLLSHVWREEEVYLKLASTRDGTGPAVLERVAATERAGRRFIRR